MAKRTTWKKRLGPFGDLIYRMSALIQEMPSKDLYQLENACKKVRDTNVGWGSYWAAPIVAKLAKEERLRRQSVSKP